MDNIRTATVEDAEFIHCMIKELATFERAPEEMILKLEQLKEDGFGENPLFEAAILKWDAKPVGFVLWFYRYSTWKGKALHLEDLYVSPEYRSKGLGKQALAYLAQKAYETDCQRMNWQVLDWNTPAIDFYKSVGAEVTAEWLDCIVYRDGIQKIAQLLNDKVD